MPINKPLLESCVESYVSAMAAALETAIQLGCRTILTSGQAQSAPAGREVLREVTFQAAGRIDIMEGAGVTQENIRMLHEYTGITSFHTSGRRKTVDSGTRYRKDTVSMGLPRLSEYELWQANEEKIRACAQIVHRLQ